MEDDPVHGKCPLLEQLHFLIALKIIEIFEKEANNQYLSLCKVNRIPCFHMTYRRMLQFAAELLRLNERWVLGLRFFANFVGVLNVLFIAATDPLRYCSLP